MPKTSFADETTEMEKLKVTTEANRADLAFLEETWTRLGVVLDGAKEANVRQGNFKALFQQATRDVETFMKEGRELATRLRNGVRTKYGLRAEKLAEFGLQPRRAPKKAKPEPVAQPAPADDTKTTL